VRLLGRGRIERYLHGIYTPSKLKIPKGSLPTSTTPPPSIWICRSWMPWSFNVYLESRDRLSEYMARLQNLAGNRPLIMSEVGLDSLRNGGKISRRKCWLGRFRPLRSGLRGNFYLRVDG